ncbi:MAG: hypothetical protein KAI81_01195, partial [Candidatus Marinimicrobia bacterium]|nr:hypothetical protein [Candidatus Neomarinimicrobiota bacterium]
MTLSPLLTIPFIVWRSLKMRNIDDPILNNESILKHCGEIDSEHPDRLLNIYQISTKKESELSQYALKTFEKSNLADKIQAAIQFPLNTLFISTAFILLLSIVGSVLLIPGLVQDVLGAKVEKNNPWEVKVLPENIRIFPLDSLTITVNSTYPDAYVHTLYLESKSGIKHIKLSRDNMNSYTIDRIDKEIKFYVDVVPPGLFYPPHTGHSQDAQVHFFERPLLKQLNFEVQPPSYTGLPPKKFKANNSEIICPEGSQMMIQAEFYKPLRGGFLNIQKKQEKFVKLSEKELFYSKNIFQNDMMELNFFSLDGISLKESLKYRIISVNDIYPELIVHEPVKELKLDEEFLIHWDISVYDDYG